MMMMASHYRAHFHHHPLKGHPGNDTSPGSDKTIFLWSQRPFSLMIKNTQTKPLGKLKERQRTLSIALQLAL